MYFIVNGQYQPLPEEPTLGGLLFCLAPRSPYTVAHNGEIVPRAAYDEILIGAGDRIDIVHLAA